MNDKERIIELVRQNVITMDEALTLLEAAANEANEIENKMTSTDSNQTQNDQELEAFIGNVYEKGKAVTEKLTQYLRQSSDKDPVDKYSKQYEDAYDQMSTPIIEETDNEIQINIMQTQLKSLKESKKPLDEQMVILNQRLRELEIFEELEDLTEDMLEQRAELIEEKEELSIELDQIIKQINQLELEIQHLKPKTESFNKRIFNPEISEEMSQKTVKFADEAVREGVKLSKVIGKQAKEFIKNFDMKNINIEVPWIKTYQIDHTFEYSIEDLNEIDLKINNGSATIESYDGSKIMIEGNLRFHGQFEDYSVHNFEELSTISTENQRLIFHIQSPRLSIDVKVKIPNQHYHKLSMYLMNGNGQLTNLQSDEIQVINKNGQLKFSKVDSDFLNIQNISGDILVQESKIRDLVAKTLSGNIRYQEQVESFNGETVSGDIIVSKTDDIDSQIKVKTVSGDIKISQPSTMNLQVEASTNSGSILKKLNNLDTENTSDNNKKLTLSRNNEGNSHQMEIQAKVISGDVLLKDKD